MSKFAAFAWSFCFAVLVSATQLMASSVSISPASAQVKPGAQLQFSALVNGSGDDIVVWSVAGASCSGISCGSITHDGLFTAPTVAPSPATVVVTATSLFDPS